jgi:hypothetical protein
VWLYSYKAEKDARIYYIAINARTGETVGCVPTAGKNGSGRNIEARHHHENETRFEVKNLKEKDTFSKKGKSSKKEIDFRNDNRVIGSLSHGREEMLGVERARFQNGANYTRPVRSSSASSTIGIIIFVIVFIAMMVLALLLPDDGSHSSSSYDSDSGSSWSSSSYDSGSSWSSGGGDSSSGFTYDW